MDFRKNRFVYLTFGLIAALATFLVLYVTPQGLTLFDDSIAYIAGARSLLSGNGYREAWLASNQPMAHFPPGFSSALALVGLSGLDPLRGTRFVNALLFGVNTFLLGILGWRMTKSQIAGILLSILFVENASMLRVHTAAMSEPLYIFFTLAAFLSFHEYGLKQLAVSITSSKPLDSKWLILSAIFTAFAYLTRYAGLALFATLVAALFLLHNTWRKRLTSIGIFLAGFIPFALGWAIRNRLLTDTATNRIFAYHPLSAENIKTGIYNFSVFLMPVETWRRAMMRVPNLVLVIFLAILAILLIWLMYKGLSKFFKPASETPEVLSFISALYIFGYLASIISSMFFFDASTKFQVRILAPVFVSLLIILIYFLEKLWHKQKFISYFLFLLFLAISIYGTYDVITQLRKGGQGYASFQWFDSEAMDYLRGLPNDIRIYSNETPAIYLYTDRPGYVLPDLVNPVTGLPRGHFEEGIARLQDDVLSGNATLALFDFGRNSQTEAIYEQLSDGLYLAFNQQGDRIYTAYP